MKSAHWAHTLVKWFEKAKRPLPWRRTHRDPYAVWISEIMLQQTQVKTVVPYFQRFLKTFPTVTDLSLSPLDDVLKHWEGLGYYSRARNLHKAACIIVEKYGGQFPNTYEAILGLPGVGDYTAGAIASLAFNQKHVAIDGNVKRVIGRLFALKDDLATPAGKLKIQDILLEAIPNKNPGTFNEALMELGAQVCTPKGPQCTVCPLRKTCLAFDHGHPENFPKKITRIKPKIEYHRVFLLSQGDSVLVEKNPDSGLWGGLYGFPSHCLSASENKQMDIFASSKKVFGKKIQAMKNHAAFKHQLTHKTIYFVAIESHLAKQPIPLRANWTWVRKSEITALAFSKAHQRVWATIAG